MYMLGEDKSTNPLEAGAAAGVITLSAVDGWIDKNLVLAFAVCVLIGYLIAS